MPQHNTQQLEPTNPLFSQTFEANNDGKTKAEGAKRSGSKASDKINLDQISERSVSHSSEEEKRPPVDPDLEISEDEDEADVDPETLMAGL